MRSKNSVPWNQRLKNHIGVGQAQFHNDNEMLREEILGHIVAVSGDDPIISTTGKASRELFEIREAKQEFFP